MYIVLTTNCVLQITLSRSDLETQTNNYLLSARSWMHDLQQSPNIYKKRLNIIILFVCIVNVEIKWLHKNWVFDIFIRQSPISILWVYLCCYLTYKIVIWNLCYLRCFLYIWHSCIFVGIPWLLEPLIEISEKSPLDSDRLHIPRTTFILFGHYTIQTAPRSVN